MKPIVIAVSPKSLRADYQVIVGSAFLSELHRYLGRLQSMHRYVIVTDTHIKKLHGSQLCQALRAAGLRVDMVAFRGGEQSKTQATKTVLDQALLKLGCGRDTMIVALGGGVVGDMAGFVAATYMRGIPYVQVPTTLLAMVDSAIGGKTGIDTPYGKNLLGAIWQPALVLMDIALLRDLPDQQLRNGLFEAAKAFVTNDPAMVRFVSRHLPAILARDSSALQRVVSRAAAIKARIITADEREEGQRMVCNFGHTIGHAIECLSDFRLPHGYAVGLGVMVEAKIAEILGLLEPENFARIAVLMKEIGADPAILSKYSIAKVLSAAAMDKKSRGGKARYVLLEAIGRVHVNNGQYAHHVSDAVVKQAWQSVTASLKIGN